MKADAHRIGHGRLVAVVVTYNRLEHLKVTLQRLFDSRPEDLEAVVVVDNASGDGTGAWLRSLDDPRLYAILSPENMGGAGGFNLGMRRASERFDPDWIVVMDDDARPAPGALADFHAQDVSGWDAVAAAVYYPDGKICEFNRPSRNPFHDMKTFSRFVLNGRDAIHLTPADYEGAPKQVDWSSFVGLFVSRQALHRAGLPDPRFFIYSEDVLYTLGFSQQGGQIGFLPEVRFEHDCSSLAAGTSRRLNPLWKTYYYHRNQIFLYRVLAGRWFWAVFPLLAGKWIWKVRYHAGARRPFMRLLWWGMRDGLTRRLDINYEKIFAAGEGL